MSRDAQHAPDLHVVRSSDADCDAAAEAADPSHLFLRSAWFQAAAPSEVTSLLAHRSDGSPIAAIPLVRRKLRGLSVREVPGSYWPFRSFPVAADVSDDELVSFLRSQEARAALGRVWRVGPVFADDATALRLAGAAQAAGWTMLRRSLGTCFEIDLKALAAEGPWPRASTLKKNRWRERQLSQIGELEYRSFTGIGWTAEDREAIAAVEANSWLASLEKGAATQFQDSRQRALWEGVAADPVLAPMLFGSILRVAGAPAAFTFGIEVGPVRYHIANNFDQRFAAQSPGKLLLYKDFEAAARRGIARISWGSGDAGYKSEMGARPGSEIVDLLMVRSRLLALPLRRLWTGRF